MTAAVWVGVLACIGCAWFAFCRCPEIQEWLAIRLYAMAAAERKRQKHYADEVARLEQSREEYQSA